VNSFSKPRYIDGVSTGASIVGSALNIKGCSMVGFQLKWTGTPTGVWVVEVSYDGGLLTGQQQGKDSPSLNIGWTPLTLTSAQIATYPAGSSGNTELTFLYQTANWIRLSYTRTSGTGTLKVAATGKSF